MKKYLLVLLILALIAVAFALSGKDAPATGQSASTSTAEQVQGKGAESGACEPTGQKANRRKDLAEEGYRVGYVAGFRYEAVDDSKSEGRSYYTICWGTPTTDEEKELCDIFVRRYVEGYEEGRRDR